VVRFRPSSENDSQSCICHFTEASMVRVAVLPMMSLISGESS
jgi:hypothetical protein